jgi:hypothetical protein
LLPETLDETQGEREEVRKAAADDVLERSLTYERCYLTQKEWNRDGDRGFRIGQVEFEFALGGERIQRDNDSPGFQEPIVGDDKLRRIREEQNHAIPFWDSHPAEACG